MTLTTSTITGRVPLPSDSAPKYAEVVFTLTKLDTEGDQVIPGGASSRFVLDANGDMPAGATLWRNTEGLRATAYRMVFNWDEFDRTRGTVRRTHDAGLVQVGDLAGYTIAQLINNTPVPVPSDTYWSSITQEQYDAAIAAVGEAQAAQAAAEAAAAAAGTEYRATSVAGLPDPSGLASGVGGYVSGSGSDTIDGVYEVQSGAWVRVGDTGYADKADIANAGKIFSSRAQAVAAGQSKLPSSLAKIMTREGTVQNPLLVVRTPGGSAGVDALFATAPWWNVDFVIDPGASRHSVIGFTTRTAAVTAGQASYPSDAKVMLNYEGTDLVLRNWLSNSDDPLFATQPYFGIVARWPAGGGGGGDMNAVRDYAEPRRSPISSNLSIMTDGRSLHRLRGEMGRLAAGDAVKPKIGIAGDSWSGMGIIPAVLRNKIIADYQTAGFGWWSPMAGSRFANPGAGMARGGTWDEYDVTATNDLPYGSGIDGHLITTTGTTETATLSNVLMTDLRIYTRNYGGSWRYTVDGGTPVVVNDINDGALKVTTIGGLGAGNHTVEIDTIGNSGRVAIAGFYLTLDQPGVEVLQMGNGGTWGNHWSLIAPNIEPIAADLMPDALIFILGTNDYRYVSGTAGYIAGITAMRDAYRAAVPDMGFVFISPALSNGAVVTPQADLRDALYEFCISEGHEFYNMTDDWPSWSVSNAQSLWSDNLHLNDAGAQALVLAT
ncbi:GDSL-type esterase/lipase family protein [Marinobacter segnicrescens]|uniref:GDSL-type esterase/lipase family protein n=1 Tax=Marinobacter segnicrescens TaxID=430453 RepID=UPI003A8F7680